MLPAFISYALDVVRGSVIFLIGRTFFLHKCLHKGWQIARTRLLDFQENEYEFM